MTAILARLIVALLAVGLASTAAFAQATKIFIASTGVDGNDGGRASPKRSLQAAHDALAAGGEIVILDTAGYGPVTISKSLGIVVPPGVNGFVTVGSGDGITINAGVSDVVTLRGLIVEGPGIDPFYTGIRSQSVGLLVVEDTIVRNFREGIFLNSATSARLLVRRGAIRNTYYGIDIENNTNIVSIDALVTDTELSGNQFGFYVSKNTTTAFVHLTASRCAVIGSAQVAFYVKGISSQAIANDCSIVGNNVAFKGTGGGQIVVDRSTVTNNQLVFFNDNSLLYTLGNNNIYNNTSDGDGALKIQSK